MKVVGGLTGGDGDRGWGEDEDMHWLLWVCSSGQNGPGGEEG